VNSLVDSHEIRVACPTCRIARRHAIGRLRSSPVVKCPACQWPITVDMADLNQKLRATEQQLGALESELRNSTER